MQAEEVQAWLEEPTPATRNLRLVVPECRSDDSPIMYIAIPEREAWRTPDANTGNQHINSESTEDSDRESSTNAVRTMFNLLLAVLIIGQIMQFFIMLFRRPTQNSYDC